jgi:hypothetical protein
MEEKCELSKIYDSTINRFYGEMIRIRKPPLKDYVYYYVLDPYEGFFKEF